MTVLARVARIYAETVDCDLEQVSAATKLMEPPVWMGAQSDFDSLDRAEFYMAVEEEFRVELPDRHCIDFQTIGDVVAHVERELADQD
jgi:acyl carrier protein